MFEKNSQTWLVINPGRKKEDNKQVFIYMNFTFRSRMYDEYWRTFQNTEEKRLMVARNNESIRNILEYEKAKASQLESVMVGMEIG